MNKSVDLIPWCKVTALSLLCFFSAGASLKPGELVVSEAIAYRAEGRWYQDNGDLRSAAIAYRKAIVVNPRYADAYNDLGVILESFGDFQGAQGAYQSALKLQPQLVAAHSNLAFLYERVGRLSEASEHWTARVKAGPADDRWVIKAREKLRQYQFPIPEPVQEAVLSEQAKGLAQQLAQAARMKAEAERQRQKELAKQQAQEAGRRKELEKAAALEARRAKEIRQKELARETSLEARRMKEQAGRLKEQARWLKEQEKVAARQARWAEALRQKESAREQATAKPAPTRPDGPRGAGESASPAGLDAERLAKEFAREKSKVQKPAAADSQSKALAQKLIQEKERSRHQAISELLQRALSAMRQGRYDEAITHYRQVLVLDPNHVEAGQGLKRAQAALALRKPTVE